MPYSTTYDGLKTDLINLTDEGSAEFLAAIDTIIGLGETQCLRDLDLEQFQKEMIVGNTVAGTRTIARPATLLKANALYVTVSGIKTQLLPKKYDYCLTYAPDTSVQGVPIYYAEVDEANYYLVDTPASAYAVTAYGIVRPAGLSGTVATTWLSTHAADLLLYACLVNSEQYLSNANQVPFWKGNYDDRLGKAKVELRGIARDDYQLSRPGSSEGAPL